MTWLGVGNVDGFLLRADNQTKPAHESLFLRGGVVGYQLPSLRPSTLLLTGRHSHFFHGRHSQRFYPGSEPGGFAATDRRHDHRKLQQENGRCTGPCGALHRRGIMKAKIRKFETAYRYSLQECLAGAGEIALQHGYELGRRRFVMVSA